MDTLMAVLLALFAAAMLAIVYLAVRNPVMVKMALRNIPRRPGMTALIIIGVMLSTVIMSAAFGTGDTLSYSIRKEAITGLQNIDEIVLPARSGGGGAVFGRTYIPYTQFENVRDRFAGDSRIDGMMPQLAESVPALAVRSSQTEPGMNVVGIDPAHMGGFGDLLSTAGGPADIGAVPEGQVFVNRPAAESLDIEKGDVIRLFLNDLQVNVTVRDIIERGGIAGREPTIVMPLEHMQRMFTKIGQINSLLVSNRGGVLEGAELGREVSRDLRLVFSNRDVAGEIKRGLNTPDTLRMLQEKATPLEGELRTDVDSLIAEIQKDGVSDELVSLLGDAPVVQFVLSSLFDSDMGSTGTAVAILMDRLSEMRVLNIKQNVLREADEAGSVVTTIFITFSLFSIMVGILLIFLIFVLLAAARKSEMGMARAVGAKRRHLVLMFIFEGAAYAVVSAAVGVALGLAVSAVGIRVINSLAEDIGENFSLTVHFEPRSIVVAYCLGMVITLATVAFSAYRVSRLNIVVAIRGLPEALAAPKEPRFRSRLFSFLRALVRPVYFLWKAVTALLRKRPGAALLNAARAVLWVVAFPLWIADIAIGLFKFVWTYLLRGWLTFLAGTAIAYMTVTTWKQVAWFGSGVSLMLIGMGLLLRVALKRTSMCPEARDRLAFTLTGLALLLYWVLPLGFFEPVTGKLEGNFNVMFVSGIAMVAAAVWTVMYNADILMKAFTSATRGVGRLRPVLTTAVAYPMSAKFRTGLTLAMFALVVFTLMVMSVLTETFSTQFSEPDVVTGGWDIGAEVNLNTPVTDIRAAIAAEPSLDPGDFEAIGGYTRAPVQARRAGAETQGWESEPVLLADQGFLRQSEYTFKLVAEGYGPAAIDVWQAIADNPGLAVVSGYMVESKAPAAGGKDDSLLNAYYNDSRMEAVELELREPNSGGTARVKVIAVIDRVHDVHGIITSKAALDAVLPAPVPITTHLFRLKDGVDRAATAKAIEAAFLEHGMDAVVLEEQLLQAAAAGKTFFRLFTGFMALGLFVGVAALGVISTRAVVERRQQIGVLRAIGYRRRMVQWSFLLESSFIAVLGTVIGGILGIVLSYNAVMDIRAQEGADNIRFTIPWLQIAMILGLTWVFSVIATYMPARQASKTYPAEALRYE